MAKDFVLKISFLTFFFNFSCFLTGALKFNKHFQNQSKTTNSSIETCFYLFEIIDMWIYNTMKNKKIY